MMTLNVTYIDFLHCMHGYILLARLSFLEMACRFLWIPLVIIQTITWALAPHNKHARCFLHDYKIWRLLKAIRKWRGAWRCKWKDWKEITFCSQEVNWWLSHHNSVNQNSSLLRWGQGWRMQSILWSNIPNKHIHTLSFTAIITLTLASEQTLFDLGAS